MLSPIEVKKQEFSRVVRGYDPAEVRSFLETVADELEKLSETVHKQTADIEGLKTELVTYQKIEQNMKEALVNAQETLRDAKEGSRREADLVRREAELEAERIITGARRKGDEISREVEALTARRDSFVRKLRSLMRSELELIELLEEEEVRPGSSMKSENQSG